MPTTETTRSLVIAPQWIGDAVMTQPLLARLAARGERITVAALPTVAPVYRVMPAVREVVELPFRRGSLDLRARRAAARTFEGRFDAAYVLPNSLKSALLPLLAGIPRRIGYLGEARVGLLTHRLRNPKGKASMVGFYAALAGEVDGGIDPPRLEPPAATVAAALDAQGLTARRYRVFAPGAEYGPAKRWPAAHFGALARSIEDPIVLLGSEKEQAVCEEIRHLGGAHCRNLAGQTTLAAAIALIAASRSVVSNDSGLMHVAAALRVPQVALFGSSDPRHTPPLSSEARVLWLKEEPGYQPPLDCAPCFERTCPLGHTRCLNDLEPARVLAALAA